MKNFLKAVWNFLPGPSVTYVIFPPEEQTVPVKPNLEQVLDFDDSAHIAYLRAEFLYDKPEEEFDYPQGYQPRFNENGKLRIDTKKQVFWLLPEDPEDLEFFVEHIVPNSHKTSSFNLLDFHADNGYEALLLHWYVMLGVHPDWAMTLLGDEENTRIYPWEWSW